MIMMKKKSIPKEIFTPDEIVWHINFKCKVQFLYEQTPNRQGRWFKVKLPKSGGFMDTQLIEKYTNQDKSYKKWP
jgi:hypothetical protein